MSSSSGTSDPSLTIVVPAFNEAARLEGGFGRLKAAADQGAVDLGDTEIVLVDDGSADGTAQRAREILDGYPRWNVVRLERNSGKGAAIRAGVRVAKGSAVAFMDADMAIEPVQIPLLVDALEGADLAIGARTLAGSKAEGDTLGRNLMGRAFNWAVNASTGVALSDTQCGFKGFRTPVARLLFHSAAIDRYAFDVEVLHVARLLGLTIAQVPVHWVNVRGSRIRPVRDAASMVADLVGGRVGLRRPQPVEAVAVVAGAGGAAAVGPLVARSTPVIDRPDGGALALFPLCSPGEVADAARRLSGSLGEGSARRQAVTVAELASMAPLSVRAPGTWVAQDPPAGAAGTGAAPDKDSLARPPSV